MVCNTCMNGLVCGADTHTASVDLSVTNISQSERMRQCYFGVICCSSDSHPGTTHTMRVLALQDKLQVQITCQLACLDSVVHQLLSN